MKQTTTFYFLFLAIILLLPSCGTVKHAYYNDEAVNWKEQNPRIENKHTHSLYLIGDAGELDNKIENRNFVLDAVSEMIGSDTARTSLVFLGNNIYPKGLPKKKNANREIAQSILDAQLSLSQAHSGKTYFIPGNIDWNKQKKGGRKAILRQEHYIKSFFKEDKKADKNVKFFPKNACGDPEVVQINKHLVYVFLDTQWWLQDWAEEKHMNHKCELKSRGDLLDRIEEIFVEHKNDEIVVLMHHPIKSNGNHGGKFGIKQHLFPLTDVNNKLWIPIPGIGSLYPLHRNIRGSKQDISHVKNQDLLQEMNDMVKRLRISVIFASGHDHGLQYFDGDKTKYIISGSGSRSEYTQQGNDAVYARDARGFAKINFYKNNESWLEFYTVSDFDSEVQLEYRTQLRAPRQGTVVEEITYPAISHTEKTIAANEQFAAGPLKKLFLGEQYRTIWATPVKAEIIDLETKLGGLTPIKKGGGMASNSLRMEVNNGKQYILRSIKKDYTKLVPPSFNNLKMIDVLADQNSASHPYNALIIPKLSQAAGVYYTSPKLVYLEHQKGLGNYNSQFPEELYLLEERPSGDWSDAEQFGNSKEIIGYTDLLDIMKVKKNDFIDQEWVLKSRLFDLFIHDWDRHDDQWRWAKFKEGEKIIYRPIPRDRDQAFYKFKGIIPWYISTFMIKKFKTMKGDVKDVKNLSFNAKHFDRFFLHDLEWTEWELVISKMQAAISNNDIDEAVTNFPIEIMNIKDVPELAHLLKERRDNLLTIGKKLYDYLSREVEITGTDNKDRFEIEQSKNGNVRVRHYVERKDKEDLLKYDRNFYPGETKEIRIYGLRGKDNFILSGETNNSIKIRIIGGEDKDQLDNLTSRRKISAYDDLKGMKLIGKIIDKRSSKLEVNEYDRNGFQYNTSFPFITFGSSVDDGFWFGGSINWTTQGWRKDPYKSKQSWSFMVAPGGQDAVLLAYHGHFPNSVGALDLVPSLEVNFPEYENYFGLGGNSSNSFTETEFNWVRMKNIDIDPMLRWNLTASSHLNFGPTFRYRNISHSAGRITETDSSYFTEDALSARNYIGGSINFDFKIIDSEVFPTNGVAFKATITHLIEPSKNEKITEGSVEAQSYVQLMVRPKLIFANNTGYSTSRGDRQFYNFAGLGNNKGLRGYRNERFRGSSALYSNFDLRLRLFKWSNNILPMDVGILGGYDIGRVFYSNDPINSWKTSRTAGLWFELLGAIVLQPYYSFNEELNTFSLKAGFNF